MLPCIVRPIVSVTHATVSKFDCKKKHERISTHSLFYRYKSFKVTIMEHTETETDTDTGTHLRLTIKTCTVILVSNKYNFNAKL